MAGLSYWWVSLTDSWASLDVQIKAAIIGAIATVVTAGIAAWIVVLQIGREFRQAIHANRNSERLKLKLDMYREVLAISKGAQEGATDLSTDIRVFEATVVAACNVVKQGLKATPPRARAPSSLDKKAQLNDATVELMYFVERWVIIDPRIDVFRKVFFIDGRAVDDAWHKYFAVAMPLMPVELLVGGVQQVTWHPPVDIVVERLRNSGEPLLDCLMDLGSHVADFQVEMQNLLLGELFLHRVPARQPIDPKCTVIELDRHAELTRYFEEETTGGKNIKRVEEEVRQKLKDEQAKAGPHHESTKP
jgi:hypothetical protein